MPPMHQAPQQPPVSDGLKIGIAILALLIPIVGIVMGIIFMVDDNSQKKQAGKLWLCIGLGSQAISLLCCCAFFFLGGLTAGM